MAQKISEYFAGVIISVMLMSATQVLAEEGKEIFEKQCASCHTVGGGESGGPDLKGVTVKRSSAWLLRVIVEPEKLTVEKDPVQERLVKKYGYEMPNIGVNHADANKIIEFLKGSAAAGSTQKKNVKTTANDAVAESDKDSNPTAVIESPPVNDAEFVATPQLIATGRALFVGEQQFAKNGAACSACHPFGYPGVASGNLATDLSLIYEKLGEKGMRGVLKALKFPTMKKIYADKQLSDEEIAALIAFAKDGAARKTPATSGSFPLSGVLLLLGAIIILAVYQRRIR